MKKRSLYIISIVIIIAIIVGLVWYLTGRETKVSTFESESTITGDYIIEEGEKVVLQNGSILTVKGDLVVRGELVCENGPLNLVVKGNMIVENKLECDRGQELEEGDIGEGI